MVDKKGQGGETEGERGGVEGQEGGGDTSGAGLHGRVQFTWWVSRSGQVGEVIS